MDFGGVHRAEGPNLSFEGALHYPSRGIRVYSNELIELKINARLAPAGQTSWICHAISALRLCTL